MILRDGCNGGTGPNGCRGMASCSGLRGAGIWLECGWMSPGVNFLSWKTKRGNSPRTRGWRSSVCEMSASTRNVAETTTPANPPAVTRRCRLCAPADGLQTVRVTHRRVMATLKRADGTITSAPMTSAPICLERQFARKLAYTSHTRTPSTVISGGVSDRVTMTLSCCHTPCAFVTPQSPHSSRRRLGQSACPAWSRSSLPVFSSSSSISGIPSMLGTPI